MKSRADQMKKEFEEFHEANPRVYELFERFTFKIIERHYDHYGVSAVFERIRWHMTIDTTSTDFKLNNNHRAYYARLFETKHPEHEGFFRKRALTSANRKLNQPTLDERVAKTFWKAVDWARNQDQKNTYTLSTSNNHLNRK